MGSTVVKSVRRPLNVFMNGLLVGRLRYLAAGRMQFEYDHSWRERAGARPISLSLPLRREPYEGDRVYHFFDNLLPDNSRIRARLQARFKTETDQPFDLLSQIGRDCIGAIQLCDDEKVVNQTIQAQRLSESDIEQLLNNYRTAPLGMDLQHEDFRISVAGAQEKTALLYHQQQWYRPLGTTPTTHLLKLPIGTIAHQQIELSDSCENEWLCCQIVKAFGLAVANCSIQEFGASKVLVVERFDRHYAADDSWIMRLPQEDFCQALAVSPNVKYQADGGPGITECMKLLLGAENAIDERENFLRAQIIFWLLAAIDGHAKNFSLFIEAQGRYRMTPLYDIISAYPLLHSKQLQKQKMKMAMALIGKNNHYHWCTAQSRHFISTAKAVNVSTKRMGAVLAEVLDKVEDVIATVSDSIPTNFPGVVAESIFQGMLAARERFSK